MIARTLAAALVAVFLAGGGGAATPKRGGTVIDAEPGTAISCLGPFEPCDTEASSQVLEGAYNLGPDGSLLPYLVSRTTIGRKPFTLTYHIRPQARWNDGEPVTATDFRFTYRAFATHEGSRRGLYDRIRRFRTLDTKTFLLELREPYANWRAFFDLVLPSHALADEDLTAVWRDRIDNPKTGRPIGNGPFLVGRLETGGRQLTLVRNPAYWGRHTAYLDRIIVRFMVLDAADPVGPLRRNEVDLVGLGGPLSGRAAEVRRLPAWRVSSWPGLTDEHLAFRVGPGGHPALKSKLVRQALAYGIDRVEIARRVNPDLGRRARPLDSTAFLPGDSAYRPNWSVYRYDPARARRLLEQAGCRPDADGIYRCGGDRLRLRFVTTTGSPGREKTLELITAQLRQAGVEVQPGYFPPAVFFGTVLPRGEFDAALFQWNVTTGGTVVPEANCWDELNWTGYCRRLTQRDVQQDDRVVDPSPRARLLNGLDLKLVEDVPLLPLFQRILQVALKKTIKGFVPGGAPGTPGQHNEDWWLAP